MLCQKIFTGIESFKFLYSLFVFCLPFISYIYWKYTKPFNKGKYDVGLNAYLGTLLFFSFPILVEKWNKTSIKRFSRFALKILKLKNE